MLQANEILHHKLTLNGYLAEFTGQGMETITADTDRDFFMSAQEAVSVGAARAAQGAWRGREGEGGSRTAGGTLTRLHCCTAAALCQHASPHSAPH